MSKYRETDHYFSEGDIPVDNKKGRVSSVEKSLGKETVEDLYTSEKLKDFLLDLNNDSESLKKLGYDWIDIDSHGLEEIVSYDGQVCAVPIIVQKKEDGSQEKGWVTLDFSKDGVVQYKDSISGYILQIVKNKNNEVSLWLEATSSSVKVVKSRPMWMYPELFDLPAEEVWPKDKKVMVIGDPFQTCDRDDCTIIEYEYADEMVPPFLKFLVDNETDQDLIRRSISGWLEEIYHEDIRAFENMYSMFTPNTQNPYQHFVKKCFDLVGEISAAIVAGNDTDILEEKNSALVELGKRLINGSWSMDDGREILGLISGEDSEDDLRTFFDWKQEVLANMNDPKSWSRFSEKWSNYLAKLPVDYLRSKIEDFDKKMKQVRYWLMTLPTVKSPQRINEGASYLDGFLEEVWPFADDSKSETLDIRDVEVAYAFNRNEGFFGYFPPGFTISLRNRKSLEEGISRIKQIIEYKDGLLPHLAQEKKRIEESGIPLKGDALFVYLRSLENAWAKQHFFRKRTKKAVPLHGFFPYHMPMIGEQNRILALTSVTMHGWNRLNREDFMKDISSAIPFLEVGGKYILGPINQSVYLGYSNDGFDAEALNSVLEELKGGGIISYEFHKGKKESKSTGFMDDNYEDVDEEENKKINNNQILNDDESAHSLVITRLK